MTEEHKKQELTPEQVEANKIAAAAHEHKLAVEKLVPDHSVLRMHRDELLDQYEKAVMPYLDAMLHVSGDSSITLEHGNMKVLFQRKEGE